MTLIDPEDWTLVARCRGMEDALFPEGKDQKRARTVCLGCPVRQRCLAEALDDRIEWGVWGGLTERERRHLLRQRPDVASWATLLDDAGTPRLPVAENEQMCWIQAIISGEPVTAAEAARASAKATLAASRTTTAHHPTSRSVAVVRQVAERG